MKPTIPNRSNELKSIVPIHARQEESDLISRAVEKFEAEGGVITKCDSSQFNFKSDMEKGNDKKKKTKYGQNFECRSNLKVGK